MIGLDSGAFLAGAAGVVVVEQVFSWPGVGQQAWLAVSQNDLPMITGAVIFIATAVVVFNLLADVANMTLDPRMRRAERPPATEERRPRGRRRLAPRRARPSVSFGGASLAEAVRDVSLTIGRGEACGLVGESGSGKSSLASALLNVLPVGGRVLGGSIVFDGLDLTGLDERGWRRIRGRRIAMVFQEASMALDPLMTVGGHLKEALLLSASLRRGAAERRALELVQEVGISDPERRSGSIRTSSAVACDNASSSR